MKRTGKVTIILCAGMIGVGVLTGCSQTNGNGATNGSVSNGGNVVGSVSATSQNDSQKEIVQVKSMQTIVSTLATLEGDIVKAVQLYEQTTGGNYNADMAGEFNDQMTQVKNAVSDQQVKFNDTFSKSQLVSFDDEGVITFDINSLLQDIQISNQYLDSGIVLNSQDMLKSGLDGQQTVLNDINQVNGQIDALLTKLGAN